MLALLGAAVLPKKNHQQSPYDGKRVLLLGCLERLLLGLTLFLPQKHTSANVDLNIIGGPLRPGPDASACSGAAVLPKKHNQQMFMPTSMTGGSSQSTFKALPRSYDRNMHEMRSNERGWEVLSLLLLRLLPVLR